MNKTLNKDELKIFILKFEFFSVFLILNIIILLFLILLIVIIKIFLKKLFYYII